MPRETTSIVVLMCPECSGWWGSSSTLPSSLAHQAINRREQDGSLKTVGTRADCPDCRAQGRSIQRQPVKFVRMDALVEIAESVAAEQHPHATKRPVDTRSNGDLRQ